MEMHYSKHQKNMNIVFLACLRPLAAKNPKPMNPRLKVAHEELDKVVDRAYRDRPFKDDNERLALLLEMYSQKVNKEK